jgi:alpha-L-fucosidase
MWLRAPSGHPLKNPLPAFAALVALSVASPWSFAETATNTAEAGQPLSSVKGESKSARDARMAWWRDAKFGMFVHWGVYAVPAGAYHGKTGYGEWIMNSAKIPVAEYREYAKSFNPVKFDPASFVAAAKSAGMQYIVITAKHHDGFAMFDSKVNDWNIVRATPYAKDPLKALTDECRKQGMKLGFYYSQDQDWVNGGSAQRGGHWDKAQDRDTDEFVDKLVIPHVTELLSNYGSDTPAVLWWDSPTLLTPAQASRIDAVVTKLRPGLIQNDRLYWGSDEHHKPRFPGDIKTPEQTIPAQGYPGRDWETCMTLNGHWGYNAADKNWKSTETIIRNLCDIASKGGNYLLNVGPDAEGVIPPESVERLVEVGKWMKVNGPAIYGCGPTPFGKEAGSYCSEEKGGTSRQVFKSEWKWRATTKPGHIYIILFEWPNGGTFRIPPIVDKISGARLLGSPSATLTLSQDTQGVTVSGLPANPPFPMASVIDLTK